MGTLQHQIASESSANGGNHKGISEQVKSKAGGKEKFLEVYSKLKSDLLLDSEAFRYTDEYRAWVEKMLDYNVPGGKLNRGMSVLDSLRLLKSGVEIPDEEVFEASALGWCIEWLQAYYLVLDDIMDNSVTRRGQACWFRNPKVGLIAVNDGIILRAHITRILKSHFRNKPYYTDLLDLFNEVDYQTASGQLLDLITAPVGEVDLSKYTEETYLRIVEFKTAYYSFYLPVACALLMVGEEDQQTFKSAKEILVQMGTYFQVQDDFLDCFGDPEVIGKIGTDIEDTKCSWLIVQALQRASPKQRQRLKDNYGKADHSMVLEVKEVYNELELQRVYLEYEQESYSKLVSMIEKQESQALQAVLKSFLAKIYKRHK
uniref:Farnesyl pyrophosphate synthase n=1 Tax=Phlegmariurus carinatus TaxID=380491 RepID=I7CL89_PHLCA|nr:farnesyl pyrophosphate synthase [Phlegmariurus carinatus]